MSARFHLRRNVHVVNFFGLDFYDLVSASCGNALSLELAVLIEGLVRLRDSVHILHICRHINDFVRYDTGAALYLTVRSLDKSILVDTRKRSEIRDKTDVRTFRRLDRAHTAVMGIVNIADFKSRTVTGKSARAECGESSLMGKFRERIVLIHELGERRRTEELLYCSNNRSYVHEVVEGDLLSLLLEAYTLSYNTLHSRETYPELILEQLAYGADTSVAEVVDIIDISHALTEVYEIAYACKNIVNGDVLRNKLVRSCTKSSLDFFLAVVLVENVTKNRGSNTLVDAELQRVDIAVAFVFKVRLDIYRTVSYYLDNAFFGFEKDFHYTGLFDLLTEVGSNNGAFFRDDLACERVDDRSCELVTYYTVCNTELFVELVSSEAGEVISLCIKEQIVEVSFRRLNCGRLTRAQLLVHFEQGFFPVLGGIFLHYGLANALVISEQRKKLFIRTFAESTHESGSRYFSVLVYTNVEDIVAVHLVFEPRAAVGYYLRCEQLLTGFIVFKAKINSRRTNEL